MVFFSFSALYSSCHSVFSKSKKKEKKEEKKIIDPFRVINVGAKSELEMRRD